MKRSAQVALLLMGVGGVGAGAYALTPPRNVCVPQGGAPASTLAPNPASALGAGEPCPPARAWSSTGSGSGYRSSWTRSSSTASHWSTPILARKPAAGTVPATGRATSTVPAAGRTGTSSSSHSGGGVARSGFGSTGRAMSASS
jgi:hypothetical protein